MTALHLPRLTFSGDFQADVSTVNNDVRHYDNATFEPRFQEVQEGATANGWWNPTGSGAFRLLGCTVSGVAYRGGSNGGVGEEPALGWSVTGAASEVSGKIVDLDPQWQMSSEIWGLGVRLADAEGVTVLESAFEPAPFRDIFFGRQRRPVGQPTPNGQTASGVYTSRLTDLRVHLPAGRSRFLDELLDASDDGTLAVRLTTFGYFTNAAHPRFTLGRVVGAVGPGKADRPHRFVLGRRFAPADQSATAEGVSFFDGLVDRPARRVTVDLGNALPIEDPDGTTANIGPLALAVLRTSDQPDGSPGVQEGDALAGGDLILLGPVEYETREWLSRTAGIVDLPLDDVAAELVADHPLALVAQDGDNTRVVIRETFGGLVARADEMVLRVDARDDEPVSVTVGCYAAQWGKPLASATIATELVPPLPGQGGGPRNDPDPPQAAIPDIGTPPAAVEVPTSVVTDADGRAELTLTVRDPGHPRVYLDGQVYLVGYQLDGQAGTQQHGFDLIVLHVREAVLPPPRTTWVDDIQPVFVQYGNLYPIMSRRLVDLADYDAVRENAAIIELAFSRPVRDPNHMPVTRELSEARRATILTWLRDRNAYGERRLVHGPRRVPLPPPEAAVVAADAPTAEAVRAGDGGREIGGKSVAMPQALEALARARRGS